MVRCPVCTKVQVVYVRGPMRTSCYYCGARWIQRGSDQDAVIARQAPESALRSMGHQRIAGPADTRERVVSLTAVNKGEGSR